ncbi:MAG: hypothetical protein WBW48_20500 [Anaerolineae bacterium]
MATEWPTATGEQEMNSERGLETLNWDELERAVERFVVADGPNTGDLPADDFFALLARFEADRRESCGRNKISCSAR